MKKLRVDQKIIVLAYILDLLIPLLVGFGTYKPEYETSYFMYLLGQLGVICYTSFLILPIPYALSLVFLKEGDFKKNSKAWFILIFINLAIFHRFNIASIIQMPYVFIGIALCLLIQVFVYYKNRKFA